MPVREVAGTEIYQAYIGSSANPGYRDFAVAAEIVKGRQVHDRVSLDVNPTSRQILENLIRDGHLAALIHAGARIHQAGCNGCIGMGQAPATGKISLRTVPRNFPGRIRHARGQGLPGQPGDSRGLGTDRRDHRPADARHDVPADQGPRSAARSTRRCSCRRSRWKRPSKVTLEKGPNIDALPQFDPLPDAFELPVLLKVGDDISTDEIMPAGARVLPYRSNIPKIAEFTFDMVDMTYPKRAADSRDKGGHFVVGGRNYGQGSSREHAAIAPRYLGLRAVITIGFARIHWQNLVNFGIMPLTLQDPAEYDQIAQGDVLRMTDLRKQIQAGNVVQVTNVTKNRRFAASHDMSPRQVEMLLAGGLINLMRERLVKGQP